MENNARPIEEKEFTFKDLLKLIGKSSFRIMIFCLIAGIVMGSVFLGVHFGTRNSEAFVTAQINYSYRGIESGKDPLGMHNINVNVLKESHIITAAVEELNNKGYDIPMSLAPRIANSFLIESVVFDDSDVFPSSYNINLNNARGLGLSANTATDLVNEVITQYFLYFQEVYNVGYNFGSFARTVADDSFNAKTSGQDYMTIYETLSSEHLSVVTQIRDEINRLGAGSYTAQGSPRNISSQLLQLNQISANSPAIESFIYSNGVTIDSPEQTILRLESREKSLANQLVEANRMYDELGLMIGEFSFGNSADIPLSTSGSTVITIPDSHFRAYEGLITQRLIWLETTARIEREIADIQRWVGEYKDYIKAFEGKSEEERQEAEAELLNNAVEAERMLTNFAKSMVRNVNELEAALEEFANGQISGGVRTLRTARYTAPATSASRITLVAFFIVVLIAGVAAVLTTHVIEKKRATANKTEI